MGVRRLRSGLEPPEDEAVTEFSPVLSQPDEFPEPWLKPRAMPDTATRDRLRRRNLIDKGIAGGIIVVVIVASVILLRSNRARVGELLDNLKNLAVGETSTSEVPQPSEVAASPSKSTLRARRPRPAKNELGAESQSSTLSAASPNIEAGTPAPQPKALQLEVLESSNQRRLIQLRGGPVLKLGSRATTGQIQIRVDDVTPAYSPSAESDSVAPSGAPKEAGSQEISGGGPERQEMPTYPPLALRNNVQGTVVLQLLIGKDGTVQNVRLLSGPPLLASAVMDAVRNWRYKPYFRNGQPVAVQTQMNVEFTISTK